MTESKTKKLWDLYVSFFRIGILTFGGGLAMLPMLKREVVDKHGWIDEEEMLDVYAIGQCTPGIIAVNTATYVGYGEAGILGGVSATLGLISPSVVIICMIASVLKPYMQNKTLQHAFAGIRIVVCAMMIDTTLMMARKGIKDRLGFFLFLSAFLLAVCSPIPLAALVILAALAGVIIKRWEAKKQS